ncbi:MAG TPA: DAK2 domain-containing protein [Dehalococcoidia bacterium]|nr:DAK2 domain-containing protein [Dehalococcoidia bacterium]
MTADSHAGAASSARRRAGLGAAEVRALFAAAASWLERNASAIDAINVFPVPDGDTGTNMAATLRGAVAAVDDTARGAGAVLTAIAHGALMSARGNSGVILSEILRGFAAASSGAERLDGAGLARSLAEGSRAAYVAVEHPVEGTILTVARAAADGAATARSERCDLALGAALDAARAALARTPELLPVLKEAGVVDSGGYGLVVLLEGACRVLRGEPEPEAPLAAGTIDEEWLRIQGELHEDSGSRYGYCTEFLLAGAEIEPTELRGRLEQLGSSVLVAGDRSALHVHLHAADPGAALSLGVSLGVLTAIKVENMQAQYERLATATEQPPAAPDEVGGEAPSLAVVAMFSGEGFRALAASLGVDRIVSGGRTSNPSVEELLRALEAAGAEDVIVLPNHKNVVMSAEQAARLSSRRVHVVKTHSMPQGVAALLAFSRDATLEENLAAMRAAAAAVRTVEVTRSARPVSVGGVDAREGQPIALLDDRLVAAADSPVEALIQAVRLAEPPADSALTLYPGEPAAAEAVQEAERRLRAAFPGAELQVVPGGQPLYDFALAVE